MNAFAQYLQDELDHRMEKNPSYSLRSFARDIDIDASALSKIIRGKRLPEIELIKKTLKLLDATDVTIKTICDDASHEQNISAFKIQNPKNEYRPVGSVMFAIISNPVHYAFLELLKLNQSRYDLGLFTRKLMIAEDDLLAIIQNLQEAGMIRVEGDKVLDLTEGFSTHEIGPVKTNEANMNYQIDLLGKSQAAVRTQDMRERSHSAIIFATSKSKIYEANGIIKKFRQSLCDFMEDTPDKDAVYALQIGLFSMLDD